MAEGRVLGGEADLVPFERPAFARDGLGKLPAAAAILVGTGHELGLGAPVVARRRPERLALGPDEAETAIALELAPVAGIDQPIIGPGLADERFELLTLPAPPRSAI